ncbi:ParB/RepB/Spo0J family partition protein [Brevibacterium casei]
MAERKKRGLGRGLGALIPDAASNDRPVDVFFSGGNAEEQNRAAGEDAKPARGRRTDPAASMQSSRRRKPKAVAEGSEAKSSSAGTAKSGSRSTAGSKSGTSGKSATTKGATSKSSAGKAAAAGKAGGAKTAAAKTAATKGTTSKSSASKATGSSTSKTASAATATKTARAKASGAKTAAPTAKRSSGAADSAVAAEQAAAVEETNAVDLTAANDDVREDHPGVYTSRGFSDDEAVESAGETSDGDAYTTHVVESVVAPADDYLSDDEADDNADDEAEGGAEASGVDSIPDTAFGEIDVSLIDPNPRQPRTVFDEDQLAELVHSIREIGVLQPVVVRRKPGEAERYELIMGERRLRATKESGLETIPAIVRYVEDTDLLRDALLENLHRAELNPLEEAAAYGQLLEDFGCTQEELSERIGRSRPQISNTLRLLRLPPLVQRRVAAGVISAGHARAILGLKDPEQMEVLAQRIVAEGLSVRASEEAVVLLNRGDSVNVSRATSRVAPEFIEVAERLGDRLDTKVNITVGKRKGKLSVEFANQDDLDRILSLLGVTSPGSSD